MLLLRLPGLSLFRFDTRQFLASLFQLPPRFTRFEPPQPASVLSMAYLLRLSESAKRVKAKSGSA